MDAADERSSRSPDPLDPAEVQCILMSIEKNSRLLLLLQ